MTLWFNIIKTSKNHTFKKKIKKIHLQGISFWKKASYSKNLPINFNLLSKVKDKLAGFLKWLLKNWASLPLKNVIKCVL